MPIEKSVGAVVFRKEKEIKYLLIKYGSGHWEFPRGRIEKNETLQETAKREIIEETGLDDIEFIEGFKEWIKFFFKNKKGTVMKIATFLLAETKTKKVKLSHEHTDYIWLNFKEAYKKATYNNSKIILKKANNFLKNELGKIS